jgi:hypothetical protein
MALSDVFPPGTKCGECNKDLNAVVSGLESCGPCLDMGERTIANQTVFQHFLEALICLFHFRFYGVVSELMWCVERLFKIGDYHPTKGKFYKRGYLK